MPDDARRAPKTPSIHDELVTAPTSHRIDDRAPAIPRVLDIFYSSISFKHPHTASEMTRVGHLIQSARLYKPTEMTAAKERKSFNAGQTKGPSVRVPGSKQRRTQTTGEPTKYGATARRAFQCGGAPVCERDWAKCPLETDARREQRRSRRRLQERKTHTHRTFVAACHDAAVRRTGAGANVTAKQQAPAVIAATEPPPHCAVWTQADGEASTTTNYILSSLVRIR